MVFKGSGPILLRNPIFLWFLGGGGPDLLSPALDPCMCSIMSLNTFISVYLSIAEQDPVCRKGRMFILYPIDAMQRRAPIGFISWSYSMCYTAIKFLFSNSNIPFICKDLCS